MAGGRAFPCPFPRPFIARLRTPIPARLISLCWAYSPRHTPIRRHSLATPPPPREIHIYPMIPSPPPLGWAIKGWGQADWVSPFLLPPWMANPGKGSRGEPMGRGLPERKNALNWGGGSSPNLLLNLDCQNITLTSYPSPFFSCKPRQMFFY